MVCHTEIGPTQSVPRTNLCAKISPSLQMVPLLPPKVVLSGLNLATKTKPVRGTLLAVESGPWTSLGCYEWSCFPILTAEKVE